MFEGWYLVSYRYSGMIAFININFHLWVYWLFYKWVKLPCNFPSSPVLKIGWYKIESSANSLIVLEDTYEDISLIKIRKSSKPRTLPWSTSDVTALVSDFAPFTVPRSCRLCSVEHIQALVEPWIPKAESFSNSLGWETTSKAFEKSSTAASTGILSSK